MVEMDFNSIYDGVSLALHGAFPDRRIHGGSVVQGIKPGDFNVIMSGAEHTKEVGQRYRRSPVIDVIYYPIKNRAECYDMAHQLTLLLGSITTSEGGIVHATSNEWKVTEDVLHVLLTYDHFVRIPKEPIYMETLKIEQEG